MSIIPVRKKVAMYPWKQWQRERPDLEQLKVWFAGDDPDGIAVVLGTVSCGLTCRDFDVMEAYDIWAADHAGLAADLPTVATSRGRHVYFRSRVSRITTLMSGELRGNGYCVLPPSRHPAGSIYYWIDDYDLTLIPEIDPFSVGLGETECTESTECTEVNRSNNCSVSSVLSVSKEAREQAIAVVLRTLPSGEGQRHRAVFRLARALKAIPELAAAPFSELRDLVELWYKHALPVIRTESFDETWADFINAWQNVRFPKGVHFLSEIARRAEANPLPSIAFRYDSPGTRQLIGICRELQVEAGNKPFFLAGRSVEKLSIMDHVSAARRLGMLCADGVLQLVKQGSGARASRYRFVADPAPATPQAVGPTIPAKGATGMEVGK